MENTKQVRLIDLHWKWMKSGRIGYSGLCRALKQKGLSSKYRRRLDIFSPDESEMQELWDVDELASYWGSGLSAKAEWRSGSSSYYTRRRQTIVLMICAMFGEI